MNKPALLALAAALLATTPVIAQTKASMTAEGPSGAQAARQSDALSHRVALVPASDANASATPGSSAALSGGVPMWSPGDTGTPTRRAHPYTNLVRQKPQLRLAPEELTTDPMTQKAKGAVLVAFRF